MWPCAERSHDCVVNNYCFHEHYEKCLIKKKTNPPTQHLPWVLTLTRPDYTATSRRWAGCRRAMTRPDTPPHTISAVTRKFKDSEKSTLCPICCHITGWRKAMQQCYMTELGARERTNAGNSSITARCEGKKNPKTIASTQLIHLSICPYIHPSIHAFPMPASSWIQAYSSSYWNDEIMIVNFFLISRAKKIGQEAIEG